MIKLDKHVKNHPIRILKIGWRHNKSKSIYSRKKQWTSDKSGSLWCFNHHPLAPSLVVSPVWDKTSAITARGGKWLRENGRKVPYAGGTVENNSDLGCKQRRRPKLPQPMVPRLTRARNKWVHLTETQQRCPENGTTTMGLNKLSLVVWKAVCLHKAAACRPRKDWQGPYSSMYPWL